MENFVSKNNQAWKILFEQFQILKNISEKGFFEITAEQIKTSGREPRLMTKFDSSENLPDIFSKNHLAILPIRRGSYIIGPFQNYQDIVMNGDVKIETKHLPDFVMTIDRKNISSEAISLNAAYLSKMIEDVVGEVVVPTIQGRMTTGEFDYDITLCDHSLFHVNVQNSQMELDGSYEGKNKFVLVEAKNHHMKDFIIRQLYYPYRVFRNMTDKEIVPILLIKHDNIFHFYVYEFMDDNNYNSIQLKKIKRYVLEEIYRPIQYHEVVRLMDEIELITENPNIPFPQANSFYRVLDLLNELNERELSKTDVAEIYEFDRRQASYYLSAGEYLGLIEKDQKYKLSAFGQKLMKENHREKNLKIIKQILSHKPFYIAFQQYMTQSKFDPAKIKEVLDEDRCEINHDTVARRTSTVIAWIKWIIDITSNVQDDHS